mmetsp:Transcript_29368/g.53546  ORF Transcript_29368/g.53546 Transcript_29368/m.53546 type:complete len:236 (+) Transcript_29368:51-758(+)
MQVSSYCPPSNWAASADLDFHSGNSLQSLRAASAPRIPASPSDGVPASRPLPALRPSSGVVGPGDYGAPIPVTRRVALSVGRFSRAPRFPPDKDESARNTSGSDEDLPNAEFRKAPARGSARTGSRRRLVGRRLRLGRASTQPDGVIPTMGYTGADVSSMAVLAPGSPREPISPLHKPQQRSQRRRKAKRLVQSNSQPTFRKDAYLGDELNLPASPKKLHTHPFWDRKDSFDFFW